MAKTHVSDDPEPETTSEATDTSEGTEADAPAEPTFNPQVSAYPDEVNKLGDQEAVNQTGTQSYPDGADVPTAQNVRRYPELFDEATIESFNVDLPLTEAEAEVMGVDLEGNPLEDESTTEDTKGTEG